MPAADITLDELLAEYARFGATTEAKGVTVRELCAKLGRTEDVVRNLLRRAQAAGVLRVGRKTIARLDGVGTPVPCYWFERPAKSKGKK